MAAAKKAKKQSAPRPAGPAPRNAELEAAIVEEPDSPDAYLVYGDWLLEQGDPLGELVSVQAALIKKPRDKELLRRQRDLLYQEEINLGTFADLEHTWSFGFLESITLDQPSRALYTELFDLVPARFLRELDADADARDGLTEIIGAMVEIGLPQALRKLSLASGGTDMGDVSVLYPRLARIKELVLRGAIVTLGTIDLPEVETFTFESPPTTAHFRSLAEARWPKLRALSLGFADARDRATPKDLGPLLASLPDLQHLGLADHHRGDELVPLLVEKHRPLLAKLTSLDLSRTGLTDEGAKVLLDSAAAFEHMDSIDLRENELSSAPAKRLEKALDMVDLEDQGMRDEGDYGDVDVDGYDDVDE